MFALRKFLYKPKRSDSAPLAQFYYADEDLCLVAAELDTLDGRKNPTKCAALVAQLRQFQDQVLRLIQVMMEEVIPDQRASRDFRAKYPDDLIQEGLAGQLWFGAECLAAGSSILNREVESESMRPLAKALTKQIDRLRQQLRDQSLRDPTSYSDSIKRQLVKFDQTLADFELSYVSAMVPVKTMKEYEMSQDVTVLFSETVHRAVVKGLITKDMIEYYDPALMFTIPRLAIVTGLLVYPEGPLNPDRRSNDISEMFRPFQSLLRRIRELLCTLNTQELSRLERLLCNLEDAKVSSQVIADESSSCDQHPRKKHAHQSSKVIRSNRMQSAANGQSLFSNIANLTDISESPPSPSSQVTRTDGQRQSQQSQLTGSTLVYNDLLNVISSTTSHSNVPVVDPAQSNANSSAIIISGADSGEARLVLPHTLNADSGSSSSANRSQGQGEAQRSRHLSVPEQSTNRTNSPMFRFNLPGRDEARHSLVIRRSLSQPQGDRSNMSHSRETVNPEPPPRCYIIDDSSSSSTTDSDTSSVESFGSTSSDSSRDGRMSRKDIRLVQSVLGMAGYKGNARSYYKDSEELLQKLFICISGVADQLQSNFAADLRNILKIVFELCNTEDDAVVISSKQNGDSWTINTGSSESTREDNDQEDVEVPPTWIPDDAMDRCCSCRLPFTFVRRRHHCRNCGLIFCGRCSSNSAPLPNYGYDRAVRICNKCYMYRINPFYMDQVDEGRLSYNSAAVTAAGLSPPSASNVLQSDNSMTLRTANEVRLQPVELS